MLRSCSDINKLLTDARFDWLKKTLEKAWAELRSRPPSPQPPLSHQLCLDIMFIEEHGSHRSEKHLLLNESLTTPWTNTSFKVLKGDGTVSHLSRKFCRIAWYFFVRSDRSKTTL